MFCSTYNSYLPHHAFRRSPLQSKSRWQRVKNLNCEKSWHTGIQIIILGEIYSNICCRPALVISDEPFCFLSFQTTLSRVDQPHKPKTEKFKHFFVFWNYLVVSEGFLIWTRSKWTGIFQIFFSLLRFKTCNLFDIGTQRSCLLREAIMKTCLPLCEVPHPKRMVSITFVVETLKHWDYVARACACWLQNFLYLVF